MVWLRMNVWIISILLLFVIFSGCTSYGIDSPRKIIIIDQNIDLNDVNIIGGYDGNVYSLGLLSDANIWLIMGW